MRHWKKIWRGPKVRLYSKAKMPPKGFLRESSMTASHVYDKAKYHYDGDFPDELPIEQGFVHTGMFLGWVIDNDLYSEFLYTEASGYIESFKQRELTGAQVYEYACDGTFIDDMLTESGNRFARDYFDFDKGSYLIDYDLTLTCN